MDANVARVHVELYKEIKKVGLDYCMINSLRGRAHPLDK